MIVSLSLCIILVLWFCVPDILVSNQDNYALLVVGLDQLRGMKLAEKVVDNQILWLHEDHEDAAGLVRIFKIRQGR